MYLCMYVCMYVCMYNYNTEIGSGGVRVISYESRV